MSEASGGAQDVKSEFAQRQKRYGYAYWAMLLLFILLIVVGEVDLNRTVGAVVLAVIIPLLVADFVYIFRVWRCPACNRFLGARDTAYGPLKKVETCPRCNVNLV